MEFSASALRYICSTLLLTILLSQPASPHSHILNYDFDAVCTSPKTDLQQQLCSKLFSLLGDAMKAFKHQCQHHFQNEKWDCTNIMNLPLLGKTQPFLTLETKEAAFVYALGSAAVVHTVTQNCVNKNSLFYCDCDSTLSNDTLSPVEKWGCSPNIEFSINFTRQLLDRREDDTTAQHKAFVLHNNKIGQMVVKENMNKTCECVMHECNLYGETCKMQLPTMDEVAMILKIKYDQAVLSSEQKEVKVVDWEKIYPRKLIYFENSPDYCKAIPKYDIAGITGRQCTINTNHTSSSHHCSNLCCDYGFEQYERIIPKPCNCRFIWCCKVECNTCYENKIRHRCKT